MAKKKYASKSGNCLTALMYMFIGSVSLVLVIAMIALTIAGILALSTGALIIIALLIGVGVIYILFKIIKFIIVITRLIISNSKTYNSQENVEEFADFAKESPSITQNIDSYPDDFDILFEEAGRFVVENKQVSIGMLQRIFKIGRNRAARIMDQLSATGVITLDLKLEAGKAIMSLKEFDAFIISSDYLTHVSVSDTSISDRDIGEMCLEVQNNISETLYIETYSYNTEISQMKTVEDNCFLQENLLSTSGRKKNSVSKPKRQRSEEEILRYAIMCNANIEHQEEMEQYKNTEEIN